MTTDAQVKVAHLIGEIAALGAIINMTTDRALWVEVIGHVNYVIVRCAESKKDYETKLFYGEGSFKKPEEHVKRLQEIRDRLLEFATSEGQDLSGFEEQFRTIVERVI